MVLLLLLLVPALADANEQVRLNIAAFEKRDASFTFEPLITASYAELFNSMHFKADVIFLNRTPALMDKDVINLQIDALRMASNSQLANEGLNCQFSFDNESDEDSQFYSIAGVCSMLKASATGTEKIRAFIKRTMLSDAGYGMNIWIKIFEDKQQGIAIYADVDPK